MLEKTSKAMIASRIMVWFHFSFAALGLVALFLMATEIIMLDWLALWVTVLASILNVLFAFMWHDETKETPAPTKPVAIHRAKTFPMISLIISAYNQEVTITHSLRNLFKCASDYRGPCEIVLVDDGSTDNTYELAWATLDSMRKELPNVRARAIKHMAHLGKTEFARTGSNKATGEYVIVADATVTCDSFSINTLIDSLSTTEEKIIRHEVTPQTRRGGAEAPQYVLLAYADALRRVLGNKSIDSTKLDF